MISALPFLFTLALSPEEPVELGAVRWARELEPALAASARTKKPVLLLFQEVPG
ncbi:MAG: hypothetical protein IPN34_07585 [Planctomycetes bacterium]|nr:hypothetical protein [Planctomycetota bacterium]